MDDSIAWLLVGCGGAAFMGAFFVTMNVSPWSPRLGGKPGKGTSPIVVIARLPLASKVVLGSQARERRSSALRDMPVFLDILTLGLAAGLSFDSSLELYCSRYNNLLSQALGESLLSWRIGLKSRDEALNDFACKVDVSAARRFAATVSEALAFGSPLAEALERQAEVIRDEQRAELQEEMERTPVKMLIPLGTLIVPAMLLAILGPLLAPALGLA